MIVAHVRPFGYKDMRCNGSTLAEILAAGEWRSAAFLRCYVVVGVGPGCILRMCQVP